MSIGKYIGVFIISLVSMMAGSQMVHEYYQPMNDLEEYVQREIARRKSEGGQSHAIYEMLIDQMIKINVKENTQS